MGKKLMTKAVMTAGQRADADPDHQDRQPAPPFGIALKAISRG